MLSCTRRNKNEQEKKDRIREPTPELDVVDQKTAALVDVLEKKGVLTSEEWEKEVKAKVENAAKTTEFSGDRIMSEPKMKCPKCGGEMEQGWMIARGGFSFKSGEEKTWRGLSSKITSTYAYSCKACGYVEVYREIEKES